MDDLNLPEKINKDVSAVLIPPLDGSNYGSWKKAMRILFMRLNVLPIIDSEVPPDAKTFGINVTVGYSPRYTSTVEKRSKNLCQIRCQLWLTYINRLH